jgi:adenylate cyclase
VPLSRLLGVSTDWMLGSYSPAADVFEATVVFTGLAGYTARAEKTSVRDLVEWINGVLYRVTEGVLRFGGIPVKYLGDGFLCFFAGTEHRRRAVEGARHVKRMVTEPLGIGLNSGEIYLGAVGHPDFARPDIMGDHVNLAARTLGWGGRQGSGIGATEYVLREDAAGTPVGASERVTVKGKTEPVAMYEVLL